MVNRSDEVAGAKRLNGLVRQVKPGLSCELRGARHVKCL
jgi:hypothetical protein